MNNRSELEDKEFNHLKTLIRDTPIRVDLVERTMKQVERSNLAVTSVDAERIMKRVESSDPRDNRNKRTRTHRRNVLYSVMITMAAAVVMFTLVVGDRFVSPPLTASMGQGQVNGTIFQYADDLGLRMAEEKGLVTTHDTSVTHDGVTLRVPVVVYDGIRLSIGIERQTAEEKYLDDSVTANLSNWELLINGESIQSFAPYGKSLGPILKPGKSDNTKFLHISDMRNQGGKAFPDQFELTLMMTVSGISEPFNFNIPVQKISVDNLFLTPSVTRKDETISLTLERVEITPITTSITTLVKFPESMRKHASQPNLGYAIYDDKGNELRLISGAGSYPTGRGNVILSDHGYEPFTTKTKSITIKTYKLIPKKEDKSQFELDENGKEKRVYIPALDITLPINEIDK